LHACERALDVGLDNGGQQGNGDGGVGREIAKACCGAGAWGDLDRGQDEKDAAKKIIFDALKK
jgi:hypothetical protein